jgi:hypothetical protein
MEVCTLTEGPVIVSGNVLLCGGINETNISELSVSGSSLIHFIRVSSANVTLIFANTFIHATSAVTISSSTVNLVLIDMSVFSSLGRGSAGLGCSSYSNVTIRAIWGGSLLAFADAASAGIGSVPNSSCGSVAV